VLGISALTARRYWHYARAWLHRELGKGDDRGGPQPDSASLPKNN
jgi:hypothetical protein